MSVQTITIRFPMRKLKKWAKNKGKWLRNEWEMSCWRSLLSVGTLKTPWMSYIYLSRDKNSKLEVRD